MVRVNVVSVNEVSVKDRLCAGREGNTVNVFLDQCVM